MKYIISILLFVCSTRSFAQHTEVVTNQTIIQLHKAGLGKDLITAKITASACTFDVSADALVALKQSGVPDEVITAMITKQQGVPAAPVIPSQYPAESGIYYQDSATHTYSAFEPSILTNQKSGGLDETLLRSVSGLFASKQRASLSGKQAAQAITTPSPVFLFVFDTTAKGFSNSSTYLGNVQSPNEFFLVKFTVTKKSREIVVGKSNNIKSDVGIDDDMKIPFTAKKLKRGVYEVTPTAALKQGEYCFMFAASSLYAGQTHKVYDFSIAAH
ncbi:MAG: hypothetical protein U0V75_00085 [Ferruginibacter sp.]